MNNGLFRAQATAAYLDPDARGTLLDASPPSLVAAFVALAAVLAVVLAVAVEVRIGPTVRGRGVVVSTRPKVLLKASAGATVLATPRRAGDRVDPGDLLATLDTGGDAPALEACALDTREAGERLAGAQGLLESLRALPAKDKDRALELAAVSQVSSLEEGLLRRKDRCDGLGRLARASRVVATVHGVIEQLDVRAGDYVHPGDPIATLLEATPELRAELHLPAEQRGLVPLHGEVALTFDSVDGGGRGTARVLGVRDGDHASDRDHVVVELEILSAPPLVRPSTSFSAEVAHDQRSALDRVLSALVPGREP